jgi:ankyrin repeat protein
MALEPDQLSALWQACDSHDTAPLAHLIETLDPPNIRLGTCLVVAVERNHLNIIRYLLERGVSITGLALHRALSAGSIPVLEMFREFGWDVNKQLGLNYNLTALK